MRATEDPPNGALGIPECASPNLACRASPIAGTGVFAIADHDAPRAEFGGFVCSAATGSP